MSERNGIEIDYCPQCRGVWLDRGELDKILERAKAESAHEGASARPSQAPAPQYQQHDFRAGYESRFDGQRDGRYDSQRDARYGDPRYRKKKSPFEFLGDIFD